MPTPWPDLNLRMPRVVSSALQPLLHPPAQASAFVMDLMNRMEPAALDELLEQVRHLDFFWRVDSCLAVRSVWTILNLSHLLERSPLDMQVVHKVESATELWLSINVTGRQWDAIAKALNTLLPAGEKHTGGIVLSTNTMNKWCVCCPFKCAKRRQCLTEQQQHAGWRRAAPLSFAHDSAEIIMRTMMSIAENAGWSKVGGSLLLMMCSWSSPCSTTIRASSNLHLRRTVIEVHIILLSVATL